LGRGTAPFYALQGNSDSDRAGNCTLLFGNFSGPGINNFGRDEQYGTSNLPWFFGTNSNGPQTNPCISQGN